MIHIAHFLRNHLVRWKKISFLLLILIIFYVFQIKYFEKSIFNIQFVDEDDNFVTGAWILKGQKLYKDVFFQHQPAATYISAAVQKAVKPNSIYLLVKRHREFVYLYTAFAFILLTIRFGFVGFITGIIYGITKFYLLGNLFLAETIAIPPLLFIIGIIFETIYRKKNISTRLDLIIVLISIFFIQATLLPLLPFTIVSFCIVWYLSSKSLRRLILKLTGIYLLFAFVFFFKLAPLFDYLRDTVFITSTQNIPAEVDSLGSFTARFFFYPILSLTFQNNGFFLFFKILSLIFIISLLFLLKRKRYSFASFSILFFWLVNLRPAPFGLFYSGFHLLPMYGALLFLTILNVNLVILESKTKIQKISAISVFFGLLILLSLLMYKKETISVSDNESSFYVNYSTKFDYGEAVRLLSEPRDKLVTGSSESLIYWQSQLLPGSHFFYTYGFMYKSETLRREISDDFSRNLPKFFYYSDDMDKDLIYGNQANYYFNVFLRGKHSRLYILKSLLLEITDYKWKEVEKLGFTKEI